MQIFICTPLLIHTRWKTEAMGLNRLFEPSHISHNGVLFSLRSYLWWLVVRRVKLWFSQWQSEIMQLDLWMVRSHMVSPNYRFVIVLLVRDVATYDPNWEDHVIFFNDFWIEQKVKWNKFDFEFAGCRLLLHIHN